MLNKAIRALLLCALACAFLAGCAAQNAAQLPESATPPPAAPPPENSAVQSAPPQSAAPAPAPGDADLTLEQIKKAATDAGYIVSDGHQYILMKDIVGGITVEIVADNAHTLYSIAECATEDAAIGNAQYIDDAGYSISLRNGKFFSSYGAENKGEQRKELLGALLLGKPLPAPPYPAGTNTQQNQAEAPASSEPASGRQEGQGFLADGDMYVDIISLEKKTLEDQPCIVITYELKNTSKNDMYTQSALYVKVEQNYVRLDHPYSYEPSYLTVDKIAPEESLMFYDEYILDNEVDPIVIEIEEYGSFDFSDPPIIHKTFALN